MVRAGQLGVKTGEGFFRYDKDGDRTMKIFVINAGSSSLKYQLYDMKDESVLAKGRVERIGMESAILTHEPAGKPDVREVSGNSRPYDGDPQSRCDLLLHPGARRRSPPSPKSRRSATGSCTAANRSTSRCW